VTGVFRFPEPVDSDLQEELQGLFDRLLHARDRLEDNAYAVFVDIAATAIGSEATRLVIGEALRARNAGAEEHAA
jgi:hypothetical protein